MSVRATEIDLKSAVSETYSVFILLQSRNSKYSRVRRFAITSRHIDFMLLLTVYSYMYSTVRRPCTVLKGYIYH